MRKNNNIKSDEFDIKKRRMWKSTETESVVGSR